MIRKAAWSGKFYPRSENDIRLQISEFSVGNENKVSAKAVLVPHAGYIYSGNVAAQVYSGILLPKRFIIISPNHWEGRTSIALDTSDEWETPMGILKVDKELSEKIMENSAGIKKAPSAHLKEHAIEVQLPFLQFHLGNDFTFVPITMLSPARSALEDLSKAIESAVKSVSEPVLLIASSDMSHYINHNDAVRIDRMAIDKILSLDPEGLYKTVTENRISMCGLHCVYTVLKTALKLGCKKAELIKYATSGEESGDYDEVVGYAGVIFS
jgi:AmmeMemoRadiSam system protein B